MPQLRSILGFTISRVAKAPHSHRKRFTASNPSGPRIRRRTAAGNCNPLLLFPMWPSGGGVGLGASDATPSTALPQFAAGTQCPSDDGKSTSEALLLSLAPNLVSEKPQKPANQVQVQGHLLLLCLSKTHGASLRVPPCLRRADPPPKFGGISRNFSTNGRQQKQTTRTVKKKIKLATV